ncbi:NAD+ kinase [Kwoniella heveanensis BCC8398]|uniref:NAD+ kinase n=1 Tax=Kwoniella heveanensis BCC8398 TaxID=1296120 RepID=A0A1B9H491_9TREE|nr:NAD+ kinase [Kwoniella heveanensis BCC8398]
MSKNETIRANPTPTPNPPSPSSTPNPSRTSTTSINVPTTSRMRHPPPPSPLSQVLPTFPGGPPFNDGANGQPITPPSSYPPTSGTSGRGGLDVGAGSPNIPLTSPCFIHSHLNKHGQGSLSDWLQQKTHTGGPSSVSGGSTNSSSTYRASHGNNYNHNHNYHTGNTTKPIRQPAYNQIPLSHTPLSQSAPNLSRSHTPSHSHSMPTSPTGNNKITSPLMKDSSFSGYDSDQSSSTGQGRFSGSAILDGDIDDEGDSLTQQLAETAQGVREMSKQLGRTKVRSRIQHVLIVTKARDNRLIKLTRELAVYLMQKKPVASPEGSSRPGYDGRDRDRGMVVYVDAQLRQSKRFDAAGIQRDYPDLFKPLSRRRSSSSVSVNTLGGLSAVSSTTSMGDLQRRSKDEGQLRYWTSEMCSTSPHLFDFVITLGGDGTVLFTSWLFQRIVPPVLPFALGSLGFLTNFDFAQYKQTVDKVVDEGIRVNLRMRFTCTVYRAIAPEEAALAANGKGNKKRKAIKKPGGEILMSHVDKGGWESLEGGNKDCTASDLEGKDKEILCFSTRPVEQFEVLNDLVVDRGPSPYVSLLELFGDEHHLTTVQADGLTVSTPTGSTAYSLSAGGSLVHPQIPALLITPICPHTLSFRPMLLPDSMELRICVPYNSRSTAWASFDGRGRVELKQGDHIKVTASKYPFPTVCADKASTDWFSSISRTLRWNEREKQKSFVVVEEDGEPPAHNKSEQRATEKRQRYDEEKERATAERKSAKEEQKSEVNGEEIVEDEEEDEEDEEDEEFDIDDKSGGENTQPSSPPIPPSNPALPVNKLHSLLNSHRHKNGVETPNRFVTPYEAPPPLSQRHLVEALAKAEIREKDNENGQRDDIRGDGSALRVPSKHGEHLIPPGRSQLTSPATSPSRSQDDDDDDDGGESTQKESEADVGGAEENKMMVDQKTPRPRPSALHHHSHQHHHHHHHSGPGVRIQSPAGRSVDGKGKAKAFAFFGQDDSASDMSDDHSE